MRHRLEKRKLGRTSAHRKAMLRNMVTSLLEHERIETTLPKAKEVRRLTEKMITLAKRGDLHARKQAMKVIRKKEVTQKLFSEIVINFEDRNGGYTRILKLGPRPGDNAPMAIIELVVMTSKKKQETSAAKGKKSAVDKAKARLSKKKSTKKEVPKEEKTAAPKKKAPKEEKTPAPKKKAKPAAAKDKEKPGKGKKSDGGAEETAVEEKKEKK